MLLDVTSTFYPERVVTKMLKFICDLSADEYEASIGMGEISYMDEQGKIHRLKDTSAPCHKCQKIFDENQKKVREQIIDQRTKEIEAGDTNRSIKLDGNDKIF